MQFANNYRRANSLPELGYADPVTLRLLLGEDFGGDELVLIADNAEGEPDELAKFEFCRRMLSLSRETGAPLTVLLLSSDRKPKPHASGGHDAMARSSRVCSICTTVTEK